jgi:hypothetical protein
LTKKVLLIASRTYQPVVKETDDYYEAVDIDNVVTRVSKKYIHHVIEEKEESNEN